MGWMGWVGRLSPVTSLLRAPYGANNESTKATFKQGPLRKDIFFEHVTFGKSLYCIHCTIVQLCNYTIVLDLGLTGVLNDSCWRPTIIIKPH